MTTAAFISFAKKILFVYIFFFFFSNALYAQNDLHARVVKVSDGDTVSVVAVRQEINIRFHRFCSKSGSKCQIRVRLIDIDAPELAKGGRNKKAAQPYAKRSRDFLKNLIVQQNVRIEIQGGDKFKRALGRIFLDDKDINKEMVCQGMAQVYHYSRNADYKQCESKARSQKKGIWSLGSKYQDPYEHRKRKKPRILFN